ncbi:MAG TPA: twin-arginine translocase subunit TatC, partial [Gemmatimonadales bacterium]|nr:twin-arginine translocase subunit TatC [Gemmatimonadales bacterium]
MTGTPGEMPFLDHLEELRSRILRSLAAVVLGSAVGLWAVQHFQLVNLLKRPIAPYLTDGKLVVLSPTEPVMIVFKLGFLLGLVLASPIILWQTWAFLAPALYAREKRALVPSLFIGLILFLGGVTLAYLFVVPQALRVLFSFQTEAIAPFITYDKYFSFVMQVTMALGISFELPLVIIILSWLGVIGPSDLSRFRRFAVVLAFIAGAVLSPGADLLSMIMMTVPLLLLYEIGFAGSVVISRRRAKERVAGGTIGLIVLLSLLGTTAEAQVPAGQRRPPTRADSLRDSTRLARDSARAGQPLDTAMARRLGLPTAPSRSFAAPDSIVTNLLGRPGYQATRYSADSATVFVQDQRVFLQGKALTERRGSTLEADTITYRSASCLLDATGEPKLFDRGQVMVGQGIRYDTCVRRGVITDALTNFTEGSTVWFLRGDVSQDSSSNRIYAASSEITSCDLPVPHYYFSGRQVKWVSKSVLVARPVVLYVRDVPILWLPFIFQDMRPGRHSGVLVPQFGFNDVVRPTRSYNRQITNIGYYWVPNDYIDLTGRVDWYSNRYLQYGIGGQYNWLNRFVNGSVAYSKQLEDGGGSSMTLRWDHQQTFNLSTSLNLDLNYVSNTAILERNAIDPLLNTQQITSSVNFSKRYGWGTVTLGGNRRQSLSDGSVQQLLPALTISPASIDLGSNITWSPGLSATNNTSSKTPLNPIVVILPGGGLDTVDQTGSSRQRAFNLDTPLRLGSFNWQNSIDVTDQSSTGRDSVTFEEDDPTTPDPTDTRTVTRTFLGDFSTGIDWNTGINLPVLFRGSWKVQPAVGIANTTSGPFAIRNRNTGGDFVRQGKRFRFSATASPTLFAFFPGLGIASRIRHSFSPTFSWNYSPAATVPEAYARAIAEVGQPFQLRSDAAQTVSMTLSQAFEGKAKTQRGETEAEGVEPRKFRVLSINTSAISYDFEQAKKPGQQGWTMESITNSFLSDLLSQFTLSLTHDLWAGPIQADTTKFDPFLSSVSASFAISANTFRSIGSIFGLGGKEGVQPPSNEVPNEAADERQRRSTFYNTMEPFSGGRSFSANFDYTLSRTRPVPSVVQRDEQSLRFNTNFSPTPFWTLSWGSLYNITDSKFESHTVRLERQLHEWRAGFNFVRNANGNFSFYFSIYLTDLPDLKFDYNQTTFE